MNEAFFPLFILIFVLAGLVKGITGMGLPTVAMSLLSIFLPLPIAAALLVIPSLVTNIWQMYAGTALLTIFKRLWSMMLFILFTTILGTIFLMSLNPIWSHIGLGTALIIYAVYALLSPTFTISAKLERPLSPIIGIITGFVTGATGVFVIPAVPYLQALGLNKEELIQALGLSFTISTIALAIGLWSQDAFQVKQLSLSILAIIPALLGMWIGQNIRSKISPQRFKQCFLIFLIILGLELVLRPLFL